MTPRKAMQHADTAKPNAFPEEEKFEWLKALEGRIAADVLLATPEELDRCGERRVQPLCRFEPAL